MSALAFCILALLLVGPVPALLERADWPLRAPRAALVLWQAIAIAAALSAFSAGLATASRLLMPGPDGRPTSTILGSLDRLGWPLWTGYMTVFAATLILALRLVSTAVRVAVHTRQCRAHHRMVVDLLGETNRISRKHASGVRILQVVEPLAYCLPGVRSRVVLSSGTLDLLGDSELSALLCHERAHLRARHDLVLEAFTAVHTAFPRFIRSANALDAVRLLVELLADDVAVRGAGAPPLARALVTCASTGVPSGALAASGTHTVLRVQRLAGRGNSPALAVAAYSAAVGVLAIPTLALAVPWLTELHSLISG